MAQRDDRYGSPYDPRRSDYDPSIAGKVSRHAEEKLRREEEQRQHQLRGCGNPQCYLCNPQTAQTSGGPGYPSSSISIASTELSDTFARLSAGLLSAGFSDPLGEAQKELPSSYRAARAAVSKWILPAPQQSFDDIVGNDEALAHLRDAIEAPVKHKELYEAYGMKMPKGALLSGPPGCGKTMFARAAAAQMKTLYGDKVEFISLSGAELQTMYVGETEKQIVSIFTFAREYKAYHGHPLLVFIDEAEVILPDRTGRVRRVAMWEESQVATFLAEMDGVKENGAFMLLASNRPEVIDQAVLRDGRCDFKIVVKRPTQDAVRIIPTKVFAPTLAADKREDLVTAAVESLYDPNKVIAHAHAIQAQLNLRSGDVKIEPLLNRHFLLEHIVSGAMAASIPARATRYAFARDRAAGTGAAGVTVADVCRAVNDLFDENKGLEHAFALEEFKRDFEADAQASSGGR